MFNRRKLEEYELRIKTLEDRNTSLQCDIDSLIEEINNINMEKVVSSIRDMGYETNIEVYSRHMGSYGRTIYVYHNGEFIDSMDISHNNKQNPTLFRGIVSDFIFSLESIMRAIRSEKEGEKKNKK